MALLVKGLSVTDKTGTRTLVSGIDLGIDPGYVTAVIGANGAGKSELVLGLAGMLPISAGKLRLDGRDIKGLGPEAIRRAGIAAVPEGHRVLTQLSVDDNLRVAGTLLDPKAGAAQLTKVYGIFPELAERKGQIAGTLSGGQQQMLALGHALMAAPKYLLIDEMSLGLAPLIVKRLIGVVTALKAEGVGILLIEQFTDLAFSIAETAIVLRNGKTRYYGPASRLAKDKALLHTSYFGV
jgi:branched-chain amino acid transport system ATP-binding protein